jgi:DNA-binding beta-propeller fold protein YncE
MKRHTFNIMKNQLPNGRTLSWMLATVLGLVAGCATKKPEPQNFVVFPPPPDEPRIQYLMSYGSEGDLGSGGKFNQFLVGEEKVVRPIYKPYGIAISEGKIYVCDTQVAGVAIADLARRKLKLLKPAGQAAMKIPINIAVDKDGTCYVTDTGRGQVLIYSKAGALLETLGKAGEMKPCGIALAGERLYVTDLVGQNVLVYNKANRQLLFTVPRSRTNEQARLAGPTNVALDPQGRIYVSDSRGFEAKIYDAEGNFIRTIGEQGVTPGQFTLPKGIGADREGRVYVLDAAAPVIQLFDSQGKLLMFFGQPATSGAGGLYLPAGLTIDYDNVGLFQKYAAPGVKLEYLILVTNQAGPQKVSVYGFIKKG